jgi:uncharacterized membrane protein YfcA
LSYLDLVWQAAARFAVDPSFWLLGLFTIGLIAFSKGAFGGGAASIGVPMLSLIFDPIGAAIIVAPLVSLMDIFTLRSFGPSSWSKPDLKVLLPGLLVGLTVGYVFFERADPRIVALLIGVISLAFAGSWFWRRWRRLHAPPTSASTVSGLLAGTVSGFTTFVAHAGGPPITMYLVRRNLDKRLFVGTNTAFFTLGNLLKLGPYGVLMAARPDCTAAALLLAVVVPPAVWLGLRVYQYLTQDMLLLVTNWILIFGGARLVWQGMAG